MKIRTGFVSNSSSSSFICEICGTIESGYDLDYDDANLCECVNGHGFCEYHLNVEINDKKLLLEYVKQLVINTNIRLKTNTQDIDYQNELIGYLKEQEELYNLISLSSANTDSINTIIENNSNILSGLRTSIPELYCPICNLTHIRDHDILKYLLQLNNIDKNTIIEDIKSKYAAYTDFKYAAYTDFMKNS